MCFEFGKVAEKWKENKAREDENGAACIGCFCRALPHRKAYGSLCVFLAAVVFCLGLVLASKTVDAKSSKKTYYTVLGRHAYVGMSVKKAKAQARQSGLPYAYKAKIKGNKLTLWGTIKRSNQLLRSKKRTFTLAKNIKFTEIEDREKSMSRKQFVSGIKNGWISLSFTVKNGKVVKASFSA